MVKFRHTQLIRGKGYSLVELLVVVAAIAVIASMSVPALNTVRNSYRLSTGRDEVIGVFETARSAAIKLDSNTTVTLSSSGDYRIQYTYNGLSQSIVYSLPQGVSFSFPTGITSVTITCRPAGKVTMVGSNGTSLTGITVTNTQGSRTFYINVAGNITVS